MSKKISSFFPKQEKQVCVDRRQASIESVLLSVFQYRRFRPLQREIINCVLSARDCFVLMPTGAGKSLCYQLPACVLKPKVSVVISPLIALMSDQVAALCAKGVNAKCYHSGLTAKQQRECLTAIKRADVTLLYVSPERVCAPAFQALLGALYEQKKLGIFAIDESHCVSSWGHDFRPSFRKLSLLKRLFGDVPCIALTATATQTVVDDIIAQLQLETPAVFRSSFNRPNIFYCTVQHAVAEQQHGGKLADMLARIAAIYAHVGEPHVSGIVYCHKRDACDAVSGYLQRAGYRVAAYHSKSKQRRTILSDWTAGRLDIVVATIAFGMGIDKADVRFVIHHDLSKSIESFYQESGRAGRDGKQSWSIVYYSADDISMKKFLIGKSSRDEAAQQRQMMALNHVIKYGAPACRRRAILAYFGETPKVNKFDVADALALMPEPPEHEKASKSKLIARAADGKAQGCNGVLPCCDFCNDKKRARAEHTKQQRFSSGMARGNNTRMLDATSAVDHDDGDYDKSFLAPRHINLTGVPQSAKWDALEQAEKEWNNFSGSKRSIGSKKRSFMSARSMLSTRPLSSSTRSNKKRLAVTHQPLSAAALNRSGRLAQRSPQHQNAFSSALALMKSTATASLHPTKKKKKLRLIRNKTPTKTKETKETATTTTPNRATTPLRQRRDSLLDRFFSTPSPLDESKVPYEQRAIGFDDSESF